MCQHTSAILLAFTAATLISCGSNDDENGESPDANDSEELNDPGSDRPDFESPGQNNPDEPTSGGQDDTGSPSDTEVPPETSEPDTTTCVDQEDWDAAWVALEDAILAIVNQHREAGASCGGEEFGPTEPLVMDEALRCAARLHSKDMAEQNYFDHASLDGRSPWDRMEAAGFEMSAGGENIAAGHSSAEGTMEGWMSSPGHCSNIMSPDFQFIGVGYYPGGDYGHMWTQTFGSEGNAWQ